jgi:hypothetical protein
VCTPSHPCHPSSLQDDEASPEYNIPGRIEWFVGVSRAWAAQMRGNDILYMMGSDFEYAAAHSTFRNLDMLVHYANLDGRINVMYSSPAEYVAAKRGYTNVSWPLKTDDFFPYADCAHCYWTGGSWAGGVHWLLFHDHHVPWAPHCLVPKQTQREPATGQVKEPARWQVTTRTTHVPMRTRCC